MNLSALEMWQRSALDPVEGIAPSRHAKPRPDEWAAAREREARRAREMARRMRYTVSHGLFLSLLVGAPVGWSLVRSLLADDPAATEACPSLGSFLSPTLQRNMKDLRLAGALSLPERQVLGMRVCDPGLRLVLEPLLRGVADLDELRDLAETGGVAQAGVNPLPALKSLTGKP